MGNISRKLRLGGSGIHAVSLAGDPPVFPREQVFIGISEIIPFNITNIGTAADVDAGLVPDIVKGILTDACDADRLAGRNIDRCRFFLSGLLLCFICVAKVQQGIDIFARYEGSQIVLCLCRIQQAHGRHALLHVNSDRRHVCISVEGGRKGISVGIPYRRKLISIEFRIFIIVTAFPCNGNQSGRTGFIRKYGKFFGKRGVKLLKSWFGVKEKFAFFIGKRGDRSNRHGRFFRLRWQGRFLIFIL